MVIFQNRNSAAPIVVTGGNIHLTGTVYAPNATLYFNTDRSLNIGGSAEDGINGQLIVKGIIRFGSGSINVDATNNMLADLAITITDNSGTSDGTDGEDNSDSEITADQAAVGEAVPGESVTYTITVTNNGPLAVTGATIHDAFPTAISSDSYHGRWIDRRDRIYDKRQREY